MRRVDSRCRRTPDPDPHRLSDADQDRAFDDTGYRLAATALLVHVISLDGEPSEVEKRKLHSLIESRFKLDPGTADS